MNAKQNESISGKVDAAIAELCARTAATTITVDELAALLPQPEEEDERKRFRERLDRELSNTPGLLFSGDDGVYINQGPAMRGKIFLVTPGEYEIENNILLPGHRFAPFCSNEIFPSEVELDDDAGHALPRTEKRCDIMEIIGAHVLLGAEELFDYFIAENPQNQKLLAENTRNREAILNVFDMTSFYRKHHFTSGDALVVTILDPLTGQFKMTHLPGKSRYAEQMNEWHDHFTEALEKVIDLYDDYLEITGQIAAAYLLASPSVWGETGCSVDEFLTHTDQIEISMDHAGHSVLIRSSDEDDADDTFDLPEGIGISKGTTSSLGAILKELGSSLTEAEVYGFMLDQCKLRELDFPSFFARCFGDAALPFADDAQEAAFLNMLEEQFEEFAGNYNREEDAQKAELRTQILDGVNERTEFLDYLAAVTGDKELPSEEMKKLAEGSLYLSHMLELLNNPAHSVDAEHAEELAELIDDTLTIQEETIAKILASIENNGPEKI